MPEIDPKSFGAFEKCTPGLSEEHARKTENLKQFTNFLIEIKIFRLAVCRTFHIFHIFYFYLFRIVHEYITNSHSDRLLPGLIAQLAQLAQLENYHMTRTDPRAISLENHMKKVPYEGRTPRSSRAGKSRTALLEKRTAPLLPQDDGIGTS